MARFHLTLLLLLVAVSAVIVSAIDKPSATTAAAPNTTNSTDGDAGVTEPPADSNAIGTTDDEAAPTPGDDDVAVAGPIGSDTSYENYPPPKETSGSGVTAVFGYTSIVAAIAGSFFFF